VAAERVIAAMAEKDQVTGGLMIKTTNGSDVEVLPDEKVWIEPRSVRGDCPRSDPSNNFREQSQGWN
jgi:hypothetical protein